MAQDHAVPLGTALHDFRRTDFTDSAARATFFSRWSVTQYAAPGFLSPIPIERVSLARLMTEQALLEQEMRRLAKPDPAEQEDEDWKTLRTDMEKRLAGAAPEQIQAAGRGLGMELLAEKMRGTKERIHQKAEDLRRNTEWVDVLKQAGRRPGDIRHVRDYLQSQGIEYEEVWPKADQRDDAEIADDPTGRGIWLRREDVDAEALASIAEDLRTWRLNNPGDVFALCWQELAEAQRQQKPIKACRLQECGFLFVAAYGNEQFCPDHRTDADRKRAERTRRGEAGG